jgi:hypothetical protein
MMAATVATPPTLATPIHSVDKAVENYSDVIATSTAE